MNTRTSRRRWLPLLKRKAALEKELRRTERIVYTKHVGETGEKLFQAADQLGLEGIIGKKAISLSAGANCNLGESEDGPRPAHRRGAGEVERVTELSLQKTIWRKIPASYRYYSPPPRGRYVTEQPMMSLAIVAELAYRSATNGQDFDEETLNKVARAIASCVDVFECPVRKSGRQPKLLTPEEIRQDHFRGGGLTLNFNDGRSERINLCIRVTDLSRAIVEINHLFKPTS